MRDIVIGLIIFGALPFILTRPSIGVLVWTWIGIMNPHRLGWGFAYDFPFAVIVGGLTLVSLVISKEPKRLPVTPITILLMLFILWMTVTTMFSFLPENAWPQWEKVVKIQTMIFITLMVMRSRERIHLLVLVTAASLAFYGIKGGIFTIVSGGQHMVLGPDGTFIEGNTTIALAMIMMLPLLRYLQLSTAQKWMRHGLTAAMLLTGIAIIGSYSRGAFLAGAVMAFTLWMRTRNKLVLTMMLIVSLPLMLMLMPDKWFDKMGTVQTYQKDNSALGRINAWHFAYNLAKDRPLTGGGFETFDRNLFLIYAPEPERFHDAHSIYFEVLGEHGFVGLALFLMIGVLSLKRAQWIIKQARHHPDLQWAADLAAMLQVSMIGYAAGGAFLGLAYFDLYYILVALVVVTGEYVKQALKEQSGQAAVLLPRRAALSGLAPGAGNPGRRA